MKTAIIISDTHGNFASVEKLFNIFRESDYVIHLGDTSGDAQKIADEFPAKTIMLNGNCDLSKYGEDELVVQFEGVKIFMCHGHRYGVKQGWDRILYRAKELGCSVALYGHTHVPEIREIDGITLVCPGNMSRYSQNTYCFMAINQDKTVFKIVEIR